MYGLVVRNAHANPSGNFFSFNMPLADTTLAGPHARDVLRKVTDIDLSSAAFRFMDFRQVDVGMIPARVGRLTYSGDLGYEIWVAPEYERALFDLLMAAGEEFRIRLFGFRALMSLRLEKSFGTWFREYRPIYTPLEAGVTHYIKLDHEFIGRAAHEAELVTGPARRLVTFVVEPDPDEPADVMGDEPVWHDDAVVGWVTSGGYAHFSHASLALGYVPTNLATLTEPGAFEIEVIGRRRPARIQPRAIFDPDGTRMRQ